jgi:STE24 endopeptidase
VSRSRAARGGVLAVAAAGWIVAAALLWRTSVPGDLRLGGYDEHRYFSPGEIARAASFDRVNFATTLLSMLAVLAVLVAYARWGARWARESAAGRIGTGMLLGMVGLAFVWMVQLPFGVFELWWQRRHGLAKTGYVSFVVGDWAALAGTFLFVSFALVVVMALARPLGERWWVAGAPFFAALGLLFAFVQPWLIPSTHPLRRPDLVAAARQLERRDGLAPTPVLVQKVHSVTSAPNAEATGMGPSRRVVLWDTLLDGRFTDAQVKVVLAHELTHLARHHIWKGIGWYALFALPGAYLIARATRGRGGMVRPEAVPLALLVFVGLGTLALPLQSAITRHIEAEADWGALQSARAPAAQVSLFENFTRTSLQEPDPGVVEYLLFEDHPTIMQRIAMAEEWRRRHGR